MREQRPTAAVILAAGNGHRMGRLTIDRPKCLLEVGGAPLIERQLASLDACGIHDVTVVIGYHGARLRAQLGDRVQYVENSRYRETNSLYSLWLARERLAGGALVLNADVLAPTPLIERLLLSRAADAVLVDRRTGLGPEEMKVTLWFDLVTDFSKDLPPERADGENVGIAKVGARGGRRLIAHLESLVAAGHEQAWAPLAFRALAREWPLRAVTTAGLPWIELDFPEDLDRARRVIAPAVRAIERTRLAASVAVAGGWR
ncbi:MAG: phosphocholine cytidylyltransferase family protein [Acidobacteria bacterium]|nr:phosphocholine cytidylyltransferase family protein [Acidobacteriota bacterium]